jgi:hypothetical protein
MLLPAKKLVWSTSTILPICPWRRKVRALHRAFTKQFWRDTGRNTPGPGTPGLLGRRTTWARLMLSRSTEQEKN